MQQSMTNQQLIRLVNNIGTSSRREKGDYRLALLSLLRKTIALGTLGKSRSPLISMHRLALDEPCYPRPKTLLSFTLER
jgi:hypothetical protein